MDNKLFLLDAYALIYRAYYALFRNPRVTTKGFNTSAIFGFCNTLDELLRKENPTHIAVCFDPAGPTFRHEAYPEYKAQRQKQPEDITLAVPYIKRILEAYRIPVLECPGYEADDVIGTIARKAEAEGFVTYMMTPDKDYGQLVTDRILMYRPPLRGEGFEIRDPQAVCSKYGISNPRQVIDLLALEGDASDNVPGCPGVGEKRAVALIAQWGSVENLLANADKIKGALGRTLIENADRILQSKELVTICTDVPLDVTPDSLIRRPADIEALIAVYRELEFNTFIRRLESTGGEKVPDKPAPAPESSLGGLFDFAEPDSAESLQSAGPVSVTRCDTPAEVSVMVNRLAGSGSGNNQAVIGICMLAKPVAAPATAAVPVELLLADNADHAYAVSLTELDRAESLAMLSPLMSAAGVRLVSWDMKRDMVFLQSLGINIEVPYSDIQVAHYLLEPEMKHTPTVLSRKYLNIELPAELDKGPADTAQGAALAASAYALDAPLRAEYRKLDSQDGGALTRLLESVELPLVRVLAEMEREGVRINLDELRHLSQQYSARLERMEQQIYDLAGVRFNIGSPMQVGEVLFDRLGIGEGKIKRTKKGAYSTTEEILTKLAHNHPVVRLILDYRALRKLLTTYIDTLPGLVNPHTGKIHSTFNQSVTATGRISSTNPNLQNIPVRSDDGREIRRAFVPDRGCLLMSADYSQIELRLMADLSADADMVEAFLSDEDIHRSTAAKIYHIPLEQVTDDQRRHAKTANFGIIYGISAFGLAERLDIPRHEAKALIDGYFASYPHIRDYIDRVTQEARERGFVTTAMGRRRMLPDINSRNATVRAYAERNAVNAPIQGSAADIIKVAMVRIADEIKRRGLRSRMIIQVHDELVFNVYPDEVEQLKSIVVTLMEGAYTGRVPLRVGCGIASNWLEAH